MLLSLHLKNWKSHKDTKINFGKGVNVIFGIIGSGKSSIMDAICFALFGDFPALHSKRIKLKDIISDFSEEKKAIVELEFSDASNIYLVRRIVQDDSTSAEFYANGKLLQSQTSKVTEEIQKILGIDYPLFSKIIYSEQNELEFFLNLTPTDRKKAIDNLLGLDRFEIARAGVVSVFNRLEGELGTISLDLKKEDIDLIHSNLVNSELKLKEYKKEKEAISSEVEVLQKEILSLEQKQKIIFNDLQKKRDIEKQISSFESQLLVLDEHLKTAPKYEEKDIESKLAKLASEKKNLQQIDIEQHKELSAINNSIGALSERYKRNLELQTEHTKLQKEVEQLEKEHPEEMAEKAEVSINDIKSKISILESKLQELSKAKEELSKASSKCPVCESPLSDDKKHELITKKTAEEKEILSQLPQLKSDLADFESKLKYFRDQAQKLKIKKSSIDLIKLENAESILAQIDQLKSKRGELQALIDENYKKLELLQKEEARLNEEFKKIEEFNRLLKEKEKIQEALALKKKEHSQISATQEELDFILNAIKEKNSLLSAKKERLKSLVELIEKEEFNLNTLKKQFEEYTHKLAEVEVRKKTLDELSKLENALIKTQEELRKDLVESINEKMQEIWDEIYPYEDFKEIRLFATDEDYELQFNKGEWLHYNMVSGGERSLAALSMRIAVAFVLAPNLMWLILDEPTHNMDRKSIELTAEVFRDKISNMVNQVFIITHDEVLKNSASSKLIILEREENKIGPTIVKEYDLSQ